MKHYTHLTFTERKKLQAYLEMKLSKSEISKRLGRNRSSIYREINRNQTKKTYSPYEAEKIKKQRLIGTKGKIELNPILRDYIIQKLEQGWSPEQISGRLKQDGSTDSICHETIYRYIYRQKNRELYYLLTRKRPMRRRRMDRKPHPKPYLAKRSIHLRPQELEERKVPGHWEGDTVGFSDSHYANITTLVERKTRFAFLIKNPDRKTKTVMPKIKNYLGKGPKALWKSLTFDRGSEFMGFYPLERKNKCSIYFCDPHSPWQKGGNENFNGRLRKFLPRNTSSESITQEYLDALQNKMNNTPRKCLGFRTPQEAILADFKNLSHF